MESTDTSNKARSVKVRSLKSMESIVKRNKMLSWDGWDVLHHKPSVTAWRSKSGVLVDGKWYVQKRFTPTEAGWEIPQYMIR